ncbi:MAG: isochorismatase family protein [Sulfuricella denitrificans]|nr:isochorismatase family protein [Sulfuricella denitrificans]
MSETLVITDGDALIVADVQRDFLPGGSMAIAGSEDVVAPLNRVIDLFYPRGFPIYAVSFRHSDDHAAFQAQGGKFPAHCVADTAGAEFASGLGLPAFAMMISREVQEGGSGFAGTQLEFQLMMYGVKRVLIGGLGDGVAAMVRDAVRLGYSVVVLRGAVRTHRDEEQVLAELTGLGATVIPAADVA